MEGSISDDRLMETFTPTQREESCFHRRMVKEECGVHFSTGDFCHLLLLLLVISSTDHPVPCRDGGGSKLQKMMSFETMINNCISEL